MDFALVSLAMCITAAVFHWVCVWNWRTVLRTVHGSLPHLQANHRVEAVGPVVVPLLVGALAMTAVGAARSHWSPVATTTVVLLGWCRSCPQPSRARDARRGSGPASPRCCSRAQIKPPGQVGDGRDVKGRRVIGRYTLAEV